MVWVVEDILISRNSVEFSPVWQNLVVTRLKMSNPYPHDVHIYLPNFKPNYVNRGSVKPISV